MKSMEEFYIELNSQISRRELDAVRTLANQLFEYMTNYKSIFPSPSCPNIDVKDVQEIAYRICLSKDLASRLGLPVMHLLANPLDKLCDNELLSFETDITQLVQEFKESPKKYGQKLLNEADRCLDRANSLFDLGGNWFIIYLLQDEEARQPFLRTLLLSEYFSGQARLNIKRADKLCDFYSSCLDHDAELAHIEKKRSDIVDKVNKQPLKFGTEVYYQNRALFF